MKNISQITRLGTVTSTEVKEMSHKRPIFIEFILRLQANISNEDTDYTVVVTSINRDHKGQERWGTSHVNFKSVDLTFVRKGQVPQSPTFNRNLPFISFLNDFMQKNPLFKGLNVTIEATHLHLDIIHQPGLFLLTEDKPLSGATSRYSTNFWQKLINSAKPRKRLINVSEMLKWMGEHHEIAQPKDEVE